MALRLSDEERRRRRQELRAAGRNLMDETVESPCISVCRIEGELCTGCRRAIGEIVDWSLLTASEKRLVLDELAGRPVPMPAR
jgi:hypothetical protein